MVNECIKQIRQKGENAAALARSAIEVVDFIIHSVNNLLKDEFNKSLNNKNIHILDPFTGTGTFITRLLHSGLISKQDLAHKYKNEIHW